MLTYRNQLMASLSYYETAACRMGRGVVACVVSARGEDGIDERIGRAVSGFDRALQTPEALCVPRCSSQEQLRQGAQERVAQELWRGRARLSGAARNPVRSRSNRQVGRLSDEAKLDIVSPVAGHWRVLAQLYAHCRCPRLAGQRPAFSPAETSRAPNASARRECAEPGLSGCCWFGCGAQPDSQTISNVARTRPSASANRSR